MVLTNAMCLLFSDALFADHYRHNIIPLCIKANVFVMWSHFHFHHFKQRLMTSWQWNSVVLTICVFMLQLPIYWIYTIMWWSRDFVCLIFQKIQWKSVKRIELRLWWVCAWLTAVVAMEGRMSAHQFKSTCSYNINTMHGLWI